jgi:hypothetical protein
MKWLEAGELRAPQVSIRQVRLGSAQTPSLKVICGKPLSIAMGIGGIGGQELTAVGKDLKMLTRN